MSTYMHVHTCVYGSSKWAAEQVKLQTIRPGEPNYLSSKAFVSRDEKTEMRTGYMHYYTYLHKLVLKFQ